MLVACGKSTRSGTDSLPGSEGGAAGCSGVGCEPRGGSAGMSGNSGGTGAAGGSGGRSGTDGGSGTGGNSPGAGDGGGGRGGAPTDSRCVVALTLDAPCCFAGWPCSCVPVAVRRSEVTSEDCRLEYPAELEDVDPITRQTCNSTPEGGCDPVTCAPTTYIAFNSESGECQWCRHDGATPNAEVTGRATDGACLF
jgi:hypothetical protein